MTPEDWRQIATTATLLGVGLAVIPGIPFAVSEWIAWRSRRRLRQREYRIECDR